MPMLRKIGTLGPVQLAATLAVALAVSAGCGQEPAAQAGRFGPPVEVRVTIDTPRSGAVVGPEVLVAGSIFGAAQGSVLVAGAPVALERGRFSRTLSLPDGWHVLTVEHPGSGAQATVEVRVDARPPAVEVTSPQPGTMLEGAGELRVGWRVSDESPISRIVVAGTPVGSSQVDDARVVPIHSGLNLLEVRAEDAGGNGASEHVAVLAGPFSDPGDALADAVWVRLGPALLETLSARAAAALDALDLASLVPGDGPLLQAGPVTVEVAGIEHAPGAQVRFSAEGDALRAELALEGLAARLAISLGDGGARLEVALEADRAEVAAALRISSDAGRFSVRPEAPQLDLIRPRLTVSNPDHPELADTLELPGDLLAEVEERVARAALQAGVGLMDELAERLTEPFVYEVAGVEVVAELSALRARTAGGGLDLALSGKVAARCQDGPARDPGVPRTVGHEGYRPGGRGLAVAVRDDLVNAMLHEAWRCGALSVRLDQRLIDAVRGEVTLVAGMLGGLSERLGVDPETPMALQLDAPLPPVVTPVGEEGAIGVGLGDLRLSFLDQTGRALAAGRLSVLLAAGVVRDRVAGVGLAVRQATFDLDVDDPEVKRAAEAPLEPWVGALAVSADGFLAGALRPVTLPEVWGVTLGDLRIGDDRTDGAWLVVRGAVR